MVRGLRCDHRQEDRARPLADGVLRGFLPPLLPHSYGLGFLPVVRPGPDECRHLKVLRLTLRPASVLDGRGMLLYMTDQGEVYVRRDGSVEGPLGAGAIQEWVRQRWSGKVERLQQRVDLLQSEHMVLIQELQQQRRLVAVLTRAQREHPGPDRAPRDRAGAVEPAPFLWTRTSRNLALDPRATGTQGDNISPA